MEMRIFEPSSLPTTDDESDPARDIFGPADSPEARREAYIEKMAGDPRRGIRDVLVATTLTVQRLSKLRALCANFSEVIDLVSRAAMLSCKSQTQFRLPPLLLVGPPGIGKTFFARRLAAALDTPVIEQSMTTADDTLLTGHSVSWRGARPGIVARTLIEGNTASPLFFVDEIDKAQSVGHADLLDPFHALLEPENARSFVDSFLEVPIRADAALWLASANTTSSIKPSILDRFFVIDARPPDNDERRVIIQNIYETLRRPYQSLFDVELSDEIIEALSEEAPRRMRLTIELAFGFALANGRKALTASDIFAARAIAASSSTRRKIGF